MRRAAGIVVLAFFAAASLRAGEQVGVYRASGADVRLFEQYDNDGYSMEISSDPDGSLQLTVRVSDAPLQSEAPFPVVGPRGSESVPPTAADRDAFAQQAVAGSKTEVEAVRRLLLAVASEVRYDPDRLRRQDPAAVFASRQAYCVGFAELAVDLLRRVGISARTVQGILRTGPEDPAYDAAIEGAYHRWVEVYYPDRGYVFSDPRLSINGVDARYIAFSTHAFERPKTLRVSPLSASGDLRYEPVRAGEATVRVRAVR